MLRFVLILSALSVSVVLAQQPGCAGPTPGHKVEHLDFASASIIFNENIRLGITRFGSLNAPYPEDLQPPSQQSTIGVQYFAITDVPGNVADATSPGCDCEGFGVGVGYGDSPLLQGWHTVNTGQAGNFFNPSVTSAGSNLTAVAQVDLVSGNPLRNVHITHSFRPSPATPFLYEVNVSIENTGSDPIVDLHYIRTMDWDIFPTTFSECVDIVLGTTSGPLGDVECAHSDGFAVPRASDFEAQGRTFDNSALLGRCEVGNPTSFEKKGPNDHGSAWHFDFHDITSATPLLQGQKRSMLIFYGAADDDDHAKSVLAAAKIEAYSFGYANEGGQCLRSGYRYIFGFGGVGGDVIIPSCGDGDCLHRSVAAACAATSASASTATQDCIALDFDGDQACGGVL
jgi:hypothetical protein